MHHRKRKRGNASKCRLKQGRQERKQQVYVRTAVEVRSEELKSLVEVVQMRSQSKVRKVHIHA